MFNHAEVLKWLRDILTTRNTFLHKHKDSAHVATKLSKQAQIKVEVSRDRRKGRGLEWLQKKEEEYKKKRIIVFIFILLLLLLLLAFNYYYYSQLDRLLHVLVVH